MEEIKAITLREILINKGYQEKNLRFYGDEIAKIENITTKEKNSY